MRGSELQNYMIKIWAPDPPSGKFHPAGSQAQVNNTVGWWCGVVVCQIWKIVGTFQSKWLVHHRGAGRVCREVPSVSPGRSPNQLTALAGDDSPTVPPTWFAPALNCSLIIICNWEPTLTFQQTPLLHSTALHWRSKYSNSDQFCPQLLKLLAITIQSGNVGIESKTGEGGKLRKISWFVITNNQKCVQNKGNYPTHP